MNIAIIGGGIGGFSTAIGLQKTGLNVHIYEQAKSFTPLGAGIGVGSNVMYALQHLGVGKKIIQSGMPLKEQRFFNGELNLMNKIDFSLLKKRYGEETITIERSNLHHALHTAIDPSNISFNMEVISFKQTNEKVTLYFANGQKKSYDYVIAADGIHSLFRQSLIPKSRPRYAGYTCWRGITKNNGDVEPHISSEAWSKNGRFGWAPLADGNVYWFACLNAPKNDQYYRSLDKSGISHQFQHFGPAIERLIRETKDQFLLHHDIYDIKPLRTFVYDRICLLGDAAHATTPNMGQGAGQAIEDAFTLTNTIKNISSIKNAFAQYNELRIKKANKVIKLSRQIGQIAQWDHSFLVQMRDTLFPYVPRSFLFWRLTFLFD